MIEIRLFGKVRRLHAGEVRLEAQLAQDRGASLQRLQIARGVIGREIRFKLRRHDELEDRWTVHRPVRVGVIPVGVPLPQRMLYLAGVDVRRADRLRERGKLAKLGNAGRRAPYGERLRKCRCSVDAGKQQCKLPFAICGHPRQLEFANNHSCHAHFTGSIPP